MSTVDLEVLLANQEIREAKKMIENVVRKSEAEEVEEEDGDDNGKKGKKKKDKKKKKGLMSRIFGFFTSQVKDSIKGGM